MNLEKMLQMQKELDDHIIQKKGLQGVDLVANTFLALQVELGEFANEGRWFKHWSEDQKPRTKKWIGMEYKDNEFGGIDPVFGTDKFTNPLLGEFVDGVHFFLSIANQKGWQESLYIHEEAIEDIREEGFDGGLTGAFLEMNYFLSKAVLENKPIVKIESTLGISTNEFYFKSAWFIYTAIGLVGFSFTPEQIEEAYMEKNTVNHQRQEQGY